jgi:carbamoyl-phosphate synthase small subunit
MNHSDACLMLADGTYFKGSAFGALDTEAEAELVFSTAMTGYPELLSDPSYCQQILTLTCPEIGNYGVALSDLESGRIHAAGLVVRELSPLTSNWRSELSLEAWLQREGVPAIRGIDTRALVHHLRTHGAMMAILSTKENADVRSLYARAKALKGMAGRELVSEVSTPRAYELSQGLIGLNAEALAPLSPPIYHVVAIDFGAKQNMLRLLVHHGCRVTVLPSHASASEVLAYKPDGLFLTNGPGDPEMVTRGIETVRALLGQLPIFGICMGHQVLALAAGAKTYKMKFGHRGGNQPVQGDDGRVMMTSQNHGFAVDEQSAPAGLSISQRNISDGTVEGISLKSQWAFGVQYHPEAAPGPHDAQSHFGEFVNMMAAWKKTHTPRVLLQEGLAQSI